MAATKDAAARPAPAWIGTWDERAKGPQDAQQLVQPQHISSSGPGLEEGPFEHLGLLWQPVCLGPKLLLQG